MICKKCNAELTEEASFCHVCGKSIKNKRTRDKRTLKIYTVVMLALYGIAVLTSFICNLAINHTLSWFFIVLVSCMILFSITNLPWILQKHRGITSAVMVTILTYLYMMAEQLTIRQMELYFSV